MNTNDDVTEANRALEFERWENDVGVDADADAEDDNDDDDDSSDVW